jgi:hypothetical protein
MSSGKRWSSACGAIVAALVLPNAALAHVGKSAPVATNFEARLTGITPTTDAVEAKVVDGDRGLWLRVRGDPTLLIPGAQDEPLLRFDHRGVFVNLRSLTAQSDRIDRFDLRPDPNPRARPLWHRLTSAHAYLWHEHRLHALEPLARGHDKTTVLGHWAVPLLLDGHRHALEGVLVYRPPGSAWPWTLLACALAGVFSAALALSPSMARRVALGGALTAMMLIWVVRIGRELYGRPSVGVTAYLEIALTSLVGIALLYGLLHRDQGVRMFTAFLLAFGCLYQGLTMLAVLTHAVALSVLPTRLVQPAVASILGLGGGLLAITLREQFVDRTTDEAADAEAEPPPPGHDPEPLQRARHA